MNTITHNNAQSPSNVTYLLSEASKKERKENERSRKNNLRRLNSHRRRSNLIHPTHGKISGLKDFLLISPLPKSPNPSWVGPIVVCLARPMIENYQWLSQRAAITLASGIKCGRHFSVMNGGRRKLVFNNFAL